ncbi:MAG TPA: TRAP transporter substrate-binding protein [Terriglobia bacterium]|nr:TRAP transporter substrate-binding protein [Terriglobia bacterium]
MKSRSILRICAIALFLLATVHSSPFLVSSAGAQTITLTYANFPPAPTFPCVQMERWAKEVNARTNGKVVVKTFPGGTLLGAKNMFDGVVSGVADIGCLATAYQPGRFLFLEAMDLPLEFPSAEVASLAMWDLYVKHKPKAFDQVKVLTMFTCAPANIMSQKPVRKLEDLEGLKLRAAGTGVEIMKLLGAQPEGMPMSAVPEALQKAVVHGLVSSLEVMKDMKFAEYCKFVTMCDLWVVPFAVVMNKQKWESLPDDVKKVFDDLSREQSKWTGEYADKHAKDASEWSKETEKVEFITLPKEEKDRWTAKIKPVIQQYLDRTQKEGINGKEVVDDLTKLKTELSRTGGVK